MQTAQTQNSTRADTISVDPKILAVLFVVCPQSAIKPFLLQNPKYSRLHHPLEDDE
jgi:hypothetical protein